MSARPQKLPPSRRPRDIVNRVNIAFVPAAMILVSLAACSSGSTDEASARSSSTSAPAAASASTTVIRPGTTFTPPASNSSFEEDLTRAGIPESAHMTLEMWSKAVCKQAPQRGLTDEQVVAFLPGDVAHNNVMLTPEQAWVVWESAKRNICAN